MVRRLAGLAGQHLQDAVADRVTGLDRLAVPPVGDVRTQWFGFRLLLLDREVDRWFLFCRSTDCCNSRRSSNDSCCRLFLHFSLCLLLDLSVGGFARRLLVPGAVDFFRLDGLVRFLEIVV